MQMARAILRNEFDECGLRCIKPDQLQTIERVVGRSIPTLVPTEKRIACVHCGCDSRTLGMFSRLYGRRLVCCELPKCQGNDPGERQGPKGDILPGC